MPHKQYTYWSCESYGHRNNPSGSGQKLQDAQMAAQHQCTDEILVASCLKAGKQDLESEVALANHFQANNHLKANFSLRDSSPEHNSVMITDDGSMGNVDEDYRPLIHDLGPPDYPELAEIFQPQNNQLWLDLNGDIDDQATVDEDKLNTILFVSQGMDFDFSDAHETADIHSAPPPCIEDHLGIQNTYMHAFIATAYYNATHAAIHHDLAGKEHLLCTAHEANPEIKYPGLDEFT
ncbi:hypothetical protein BS17DRAFT_767724 [Gyrodon lividus]|nr:hypothetical protein BS17DRAFT_767724 [Gyrodon lividus]